VGIEPTFSMSKTNVLPIKLPLKMELMGFEPTTSCMQNKRSTKLNYSPLFKRRLWDSNPYLTDRQPAILAIKLNRLHFS
jgi:hypothetical protein